MNELIVVNYENENPTVLGRDLHEKLGIKTQYSIWIKRMIEYGFAESQDYSIINFDYGNLGTCENHQLTLEMAKHIAMIQRSEIGMKIRKYFIECEKKLNKPMSLKESLLWQIRLIEEKEKLALERDIAIETKAEIGSRREATAMNLASQLKKENNKLREEIGFNRNFATIKRMEIETKRKFHWRELKNYCKSYDLEMPYVPDVNYGKVRAYPADAWYEVYDIDLDDLF